MKPDHPVRLPLQIGTSSAEGLLRASLVVVPAIALTVIGMVGLFRVQGDEPVWPSLALPLGVGLAVLAVQQLVSAWKGRATDVVLDASGVRFEGPTAVRALRWQDIDASGTSLVETQESPTLLGLGKPRARQNATNELGRISQRAAQSHRSVERLLLSLHSGGSLVIAEGSDAIERESLHAFRDTLHAIGRETGEPSTDAVDSPELVGTRQIEIFRCDHCGAPGTPATTETTSCSYCATLVRRGSGVRLEAAARPRSHRGAERSLGRVGAGGT